MFYSWLYVNINNLFDFLYWFEFLLEVWVKLVVLSSFIYFEDKVDFNYFVFGWNYKCKFVVGIYMSVSSW